MSALDRFRAPRPAPSPARRLLGLLAMAAAGLAAGVLAKWADFSGIRLLGDVFSELPVWILLGLVIARCSGSPGRAAAHALVFFLAMIPAYYLAAEWMDGVWGMTYVYGWTIVACLSPFAACAVWYAFGRGWVGTDRGGGAAGRSDGAAQAQPPGLCAGGSVRGAGVRLESNKENQSNTN